MSIDSVTIKEIPKDDDVAKSSSVVDSTETGAIAEAVKDKYSSNITGEDGIPLQCTSHHHHNEDHHHSQFVDHHFRHRLEEDDFSRPTSVTSDLESMESFKAQRGSSVASSLGRLSLMSIVDRNQIFEADDAITEDDTIEKQSAESGSTNDTKSKQRKFTNINSLGEDDLISTSSDDELDDKHDDDDDLEEALKHRKTSLTLTSSLPSRISLLPAGAEYPGIWDPLNRLFLDQSSKLQPQSRLQSASSSTDSIYALFGSTYNVSRLNDISEMIDQ